MLRQTAAFHKNKNSKDGYNSNCKRCTKAYKKVHYKVNFDVINAKNKAWAKANPEKAKFNSKVRQTTYRKAHPRRIKASSKTYRKANPEKVKAANSKWHRDNPDKCNVLRAKHRALKLKQTPDLTKAQEALIRMYYRVSTWLGSGFHVDHIQPLSKKGLHHPANFQIIPAHVNLSKHNNESYQIPKNQIIRIPAAYAAV